MHTNAGPVVRVARWSAHHPWRAIALWLALVAAAVAGGIVAGTVELTDGQQINGESARAERTIETAGLADPIREQALIRNRAGGPIATDAQAAANDIARRVDAIPAVGTVARPVTSADGTATVVSWEITRPDTNALPAMSQAISAASAAHPQLRIEQVGDLSIEKALENAIGDDLSTAERLSLPITLGILLIAFGALIAAIVPVLLALSAVALAVGVTAVASHVTPVSDAATSVIFLIGLAVGVDYSMFFMRRARDERARGATALDAVEIAAGTAGRAVVVSGVTVLIAMSGMFLSGNNIFSSFAIGTMVVVAAAVVASITVLPALAGRLGKWIDRPRVPFLHRLARTDGGSRIWDAVLTRVLRRPGVSVVIAAGALIALALPATGMTTKLLGDEDLPRSLRVMQTYDALTAAFPAKGSQHVVVVKGPDVTAPRVTEAIAELGRTATATGHFALTGAPEVVTSPDRTVAEVFLPYPGANGGEDAKRGLTALREQIVPDTVGRVATADVTGNTAVDRDFNDQLSSRLPLVFAFVLGLTFLLMLMSFRSVAVAGLTVVLNLLSVAAAYGVLVLVFQSHWAEGPLDFQSNGGIIAWLPLFLFVILFGLSMDYHVFVLSRVREAFDRGLSNRDAIHAGVTSSAGVVTSAAVVMIAVFAVFATLTSLDFKQLGVGLAAAIAIDATVVRGVLLPAGLAILGERTWHMPAWLRWLPHIDRETSSSPAIGAASPVEG